MTILVKCRCWIEDCCVGHVCGVDYMLIRLWFLFSHDTFLPCDKRALNVSKRKLSIITIAFNQTLIMIHIRKDCLCILFYPQEQEDFSHNLAFRNLRNETFPSVKYADQKEKIFEAHLRKIDWVVAFNRNRNFLNCRTSSLRLLLYKHDKMNDSWEFGYRDDFDCLKNKMKMSWRRH